MAQINFEDHIKRKLEQRELKPSQKAWENLSAQLDAVNSKKKIINYWWLGLAASFIGILMIASFLYNGNEIGNGNETPTVVDSKQKKIDESIELNNEAISSDEEEIDQVVEAVPSSKKEKTIIKERSVEITKSKNDQPRTKSKATSDAVASNTGIIDKEPTREAQNIQSILTFEEQKIIAVAAEIKALQATSNSISEKEIDALLEAAQKEIALNEIYSETTKSVDADALLRSVEEDLEESFRARVFNLLQSGYDGVKTAVAERNN